MQPPAKPASETVVSVEFQCPAGSLAARLLRHHPLAVLQTAAHEESALLSQLAGRLHAASILAGGLLLTATQHDTCIAKLGLMQAVAVAAGVSRYVAALRRSAAPTAASLDLRGAKELGEEAGSCCHRHSHAGEALESQLHIQEQAATGPYRIRWSSQLPSSPTHTGSATDTHGGPQAAAGAPTPALQDVPLREPNGAPAGPRAVPRAPQGIWTSLRPQQLPQVAAHAVRLEAMRRALARVAAERGVEEEPGARDGETGGGHREQGGGVRSHSCAGVELEHVGVCSCCRRWAMAWKLAVAGARIAAALAVAAALWAVLGGEAAWTRFTRGLLAPV